MFKKSIESNITVETNLNIIDIGFETDLTDIKINERLDIPFKSKLEDIDGGDIYSERKIRLKGISDGLLGIPNEKTHSCSVLMELTKCFNKTIDLNTHELSKQISRKKAEIENANPTYNIENFKKIFNTNLKKNHDTHLNENKRDELDNITHKINILEHRPLGFEQDSTVLHPYFFTSIFCVLESLMNIVFMREYLSEHIEFLVLCIMMPVIVAIMAHYVGVRFKKHYDQTFKRLFIDSLLSIGLLISTISAILVIPFMRYAILSGDNSQDANLLSFGIMAIYILIFILSAKGGYNNELEMLRYNSHKEFNHLENKRKKISDEMTAFVNYSNNICFSHIKKSLKLVDIQLSALKKIKDNINLVKVSLESNIAWFNTNTENLVKKSVYLYNIYINYNNRYRFFRKNKFPEKFVEFNISELQNNANNRVIEIKNYMIIFYFMPKSF